MNIFENLKLIESENPFHSELEVRKCELAASGDFPDWCRFDPFGIKHVISGSLDAAETLSAWLAASADTTKVSLAGEKKLSAFHLKFGSLQLDPNAILAFASQYGFLGLREYHRDYIEDELIAEFGDVDADGLPHYKPFEPVEDWYEEILRVRLLQSMIRLVRSDDRQSELKEVTIIEDTIALGRAILRPLGDPRVLELHGSILPPKWWDLEPLRFEGVATMWRVKNLTLDSQRNLRQSIRTYVQHVINKELSRQCYPQIEFKEGSSIKLVTKSLLGAIYASLARDVTGESGLARQCAGCGQWFMAEHAKLKHCSDSCKTKAYRRRQAAKKEDNNG